MEKILVSSCLLGKPCRWHGKKISKSSYIKKLERQNQKDLFCQGEELLFINVCPEMLAGLGVPRKPVKRHSGRIFETCEKKENRMYYTGKERTKEFELGAQKTLEICKKEGIKKAILCKWSPSCDISGKTGKLLKRNNVEVINTF